MKTLALVLGTLGFLAPINAAMAGIPLPVPEPTTLSLMAIGVVGAVIASRFRKKK